MTASESESVSPHPPCRNHLSLNHPNRGLSPTPGSIA